MNEQINLWRKEITNDLKEKISNLAPDHSFKEVLEYTIFPTGKLFRPLLTYCVSKDIGYLGYDQKLLAQAIEIHHTYTLIHDDLPSMDDDDFRRGRLSSHKKFNEWSSILAGDALLNTSYEVLSDIKSPNILKLLKKFTASTGPKGLILGQVMDLGGESKTLEQILLLHELKTARLIQLAIVGPCILSGKDIMIPDLENIGLCLGINFQLLDDLCELTEDLSEHEKEVNPFLRFETERILEIVEDNSSTLKKLLNKNNLKCLEDYINIYLKQIRNKLNSGIENINLHTSLTRQQIDKIC